MTPGLDKLGSGPNTCPPGVRRCHHRIYIKESLLTHCHDLIAPRLTRGCRKRISLRPPAEQCPGSRRRPGGPGPGPRSL